MRGFLVKNQKHLMKLLLSEDYFDKWFLVETTIIKGASLVLDGRKEDGSIAEYGSLRNVVYEFIRGKETPSYMKFILIFPKQTDDVESRSVNVIYRDGEMSITTGVALKIFSLDKTAEKAWDLEVEQMLKASEVDIEF